MNENKKARLRVRPAGETQWVVLGALDDQVAWDNLRSELEAEDDNHEDEGILEIGIVQLSDTEVQALGEFDGW